MVFSPLTTRATFTNAKFHLTIRANSIAFYHSGKLDETGGRKTRLRQLARELCMKRPARHRSSPMELAERLNPLRTGAAASRPILQARPLALRLHRERAIVAKNTDLCAADLHGGRAQRRDNRRPRMLARKRTHRASCSPGGGRPSSPQRGMPRVRHRRGVFFRPSVLPLVWYC